MANNKTQLTIINSSALKNAIAINDSVAQNMSALENADNCDSITINGVNFTIKELTINFPDSYFDVMFNSNFLEANSNQTSFTIEFPQKIDANGIHSKRFMDLIRSEV